MMLIGTFFSFSGIAQEIGDSIGKKDRIVPLFRRLNELEKHLEPASATESGLSLEARAELILNEEKQIRQTNNFLEQAGFNSRFCTEIFLR